MSLSNSLTAINTYYQPASGQNNTAISTKSHYFNKRNNVKEKTVAMDALVKVGVSEADEMKHLDGGIRKSMLGTNAKFNIGHLSDRKRNSSVIVHHGPNKKKTSTTVINDHNYHKANEVMKKDMKVLEQSKFSGFSDGSCKEKYQRRKVSKNVKYKNEADTRSSVRLIGGILYDLRCIICNIIPRKPNRSELYRHYSQEHFNVQLKKEFGHLKKCPFCDLDLIHRKISTHFGQKHDMVEKFLPEEAKIFKSSLNSKRSLTRKKYIEKMEPGFLEKKNGILKVVIVDGFEVEFRTETDEYLNTTSINDGKYADVKVKCNICKEVSGAEATVQHVKFDHQMKATTTNTSVDQPKGFLMSGHITLLSPRPAENQLLSE